MTRTPYFPMHTQDPSDPRFIQNRGFGVVGARRPIYKTSNSSADVNGNSQQSTANFSMHNTGQYRLFDVAQQPVPFVHYQQQRYDEYLTSPTHLGYAHQPMESNGYATPTRPSNQQTTSGNSWREMPTSLHQSLPPPSSPPYVNTNALQSPDTLASTLSTLQLSPPQRSPPQLSPTDNWASVDTAEDESDSDDEEEGGSMSHPNKYPVEIEYHEIQHCGYRRQSTRSGPKLKQQTTSVYDPMTSQQRPQLHRIKYYQKHLVRICRCGKYSQMDGALVHGRANDCDGYEIHYSQKCKWKAYDDFKSGKRVLIRLCKCYKPF